VIEINDQGVVVIDTKSGDRRLLEAEQIVVALGSAPEQSLAGQLEGKVDELHVIGDCQCCRTALEAIEGGFLVGNNL
jgi:hypothetical protein